MDWRTSALICHEYGITCLYRQSHVPYNSSRENHTVSSQVSGDARVRRRRRMVGSWWSHRSALVISSSSYQ